MSNLFLTVLNMSLTASYVILFVILVRLMLKKAPKIISYALWAVVAFRLLIPFSFESMYSLMPWDMNIEAVPNDIIYQESPQINSGIEIIDTVINESLPAPAIGASANPLQIYLEIGGYIWVLGMVVLLLYSLISIVILKKQLKNAERIEGNVFEAKNLQTPFVLGLIRPRIYLPVGLTAEEKSYILLHEQTHINRKDHVIKIFAFLTLSIHWFNPLVWIAFVLMNRDMELSCDERVLKETKEDIKKPYANSLLSLATGKHILNGSPLAFGEGNVKGRIKNVLNYKKPKFLIAAISIVVVIAVAIGLMANPKTAKNATVADNISGESLEMTMKIGSSELLWHARTQYIGDNSAVGRLISLLSVPEDVQYDHFKLHTSEEPYEIEIIYFTSSESLTQFEKESIQSNPFRQNAPTNQFRKNALILLALVDNAQGVRTVLTDGERETSFIITREWADYAVGEDVRNYAESPETLQKLMEMQLLSNAKPDDQREASEAVFDQTNYEKIRAYLKDEVVNAFSPYYELLDFIISDYHEEVVDGNVEATFLYTVKHKNYDKDPDTVGYIKEAKERGDRNYQILYDEYLQVQDMNFYFKAIITKNDFITLYTQNPNTDSDWQEVRISDFILGSE